jgi:predicted dehydrogenase
MTRSRNARFTRREMLARSAAATAAIAAPLVVPGAVLGLDGATAPSNRLNVGFIGVGLMGRGHFRIFANYSDVHLRALCDVDAARREHSTQMLRKIYGDLQPSGRYDGFRDYNDFRELLARDDIDAVVVATGDRWHPEICVRAAQAGKDIYCEKPISLTIQQARTMVETVRRHQCVFQTGLQQRNSAEYVKAVELIRAGRIGRVKLAYVSASGASQYVNLPAEPLPEGLDWDMWLGPCPWHPYNYRYHHTGEPKHVVPWECNRAFGGGAMTSGLVHNLDSAQQGLGRDDEGPVRITLRAPTAPRRSRSPTPMEPRSFVRPDWSPASISSRPAGIRRRPS